MVDYPDVRLKRWINSVLDGVAVSLDITQAKSSKSGVGLYLLEVVPSSVASAVRPAPLQLTFRYLVMTAADAMEAAHEMLTQLMFAALGKSDFEVERTPVSMDLWRALEMAPQPAMLLRVLYTQDRPRDTTPIVRHPVRVEVVSRVAFFGQVLGPADEPLAACTVSVPQLGLTTSSDGRGRFSFAGVPYPGSIQLLLRARGEHVSVTCDRISSDSKAPMIIRFTALED